MSTPEPSKKQGQVCPLTTEQLCDLIIRFVDLYNKPDHIHLYSYQRVFLRRIVESLLVQDSATVTGLFSRQCLHEDTVVLDRDGTACRIKNHPRAWKTKEGAPVFRVRAQNGFEVIATANHPFLTPRGWVRCDELREGDALCVLDGWDRFGDGHVESTIDVYVNRHRTDRYQESWEITEAHGRFLGYLTADGYSFAALDKGQSVKFTNITPAYLAEVEELVYELFPDVDVRWYAKGKGYDILLVARAGRSAKTSTLRRFLEAVRPDDKFPTAIFGAPREAIIGFLNRLFSADGYASRGLGLACGGSRVYAHYCQALLARLGIVARVKEEVMGGNPFFRLVIDRQRDMDRFLETVGPIYGKETACAENLDFGVRRKSTHTFEPAPVGEDGERRVWSPLASVEPWGEADVWDVTYPGKGWFFAQGIAVHNSGKSEALASLAVALCVFLPSLARVYPDDPRLGPFIRGLYVGIFAPKLPQATIIQGRVRQRAGLASSSEINSDPEINTYVTASRGDMVAWSNGSFVRARTANEHANVEGDTYHIIFIDEAQLVSQLKVQKELSPMLAATGGSMVKIGTASYHKGGFHDSIKNNVALFEKGGPRNHFEFPYDVVIREKRRAFEETGNDYHLRYERWVQAELAKMGGNLDNETFKMNFRLLWQEASGGALSLEVIERQRVPEGTLAPSYGYSKQVAGLDVGKVQDPSVLTILEVSEVLTIDSRALLRAGDDPPMYPAKTVVGWHECMGAWEGQLTSIIGYLERWNVEILVVDATGVGDPIAERLQLLLPHIQVVPFRYGLSTSDTLFKLYLQEWEAGRFFYPASPEVTSTHHYQTFVYQHERLIKQYNGPFLTCMAPEGEHDDYVDSAALANYAAHLQGDGRHRDAVVEQVNVLYSFGGRQSAFHSRADRYRQRR